MEDYLQCTNNKLDENMDWDERFKVTNEYLGNVRMLNIVHNSERMMIK